MGDNLLLYVVPLMIFGGAAWLGHWLGRTGRMRRVLTLGLMSSAALALLLLYAEAMDDPWAGIATAALTVLGLGPVVVGVLVGGALGWLRRRR